MDAETLERISDIHCVVDVGIASEVFRTANFGRCGGMLGDEVPLMAGSATVPTENWRRRWNAATSIGSSLIRT